MLELRQQFAACGLFGTLGGLIGRFVDVDVNIRLSLHFFYQSTACWVLGGNLGLKLNAALKQPTVGVLGCAA